MDVGISEANNLLAPKALNPGNENKQVAPFIDYDCNFCELWVDCKEHDETAQSNDVLLFSYQIINTLISTQR